MCVSMGQECLNEPDDVFVCSLCLHACATIRYSRAARRAGCMLFLVQWANGRPWGALLAPHSGGGGSLDVLSQASSSVH